MKRFTKIELSLLAAVVLLIAVSEYYFLILDEPLKAIFIGLWPPTILGLMIYLTVKTKR